MKINKKVFQFPIRKFHEDYELRKANNVIERRSSRRRGYTLVKMIASINGSYKVRCYTDSPREEVISGALGAKYFSLRNNRMNCLWFKALPPPPPAPKKGRKWPRSTMWWLGLLRRTTKVMHWNLSLNEWK